jgi:diaminopimelate decarboxylase
MSFAYKNGKLYCENVSIEDIAKQVGTPFYLYSYETLVENYRRLLDVFAPLNALICYAYKANSNLTICRIFAKLGSGADITSGGELFKALKAGVPAYKIVFNGNGKSSQELRFALSSEILMINVDSTDELLTLAEIAEAESKVAPISLRINSHVDAQTHPYIATALATSKFGVDINQAKDVFLKANRMDFIKPIGIHGHIGSQITHPEPFIENVEKLAELAIELKEKGVPIEYLNMGGGFGIVYKDEFPIDLDVISKKISYIAQEAKCKLILEPGRFLVGNAGVLITKVLYFKESAHRNFIVVDAAMNDLIRPSLYNSYHRIITINEHQRGKEMTVDVVGPICEEGDFLAKTRKMAKPDKGELLAIMDAGAYGFAMSSNYNSRTKPAEVLVIGENFYTIRKREEYEDLVSKEEIPQVLEEL